jgi:integrase/recombinase XerD
MALSKQAKTLSKSQVDTALAYLTQTRYPIRNRVTFLLSVKAGLRAKEIASLTWDMITTADGEIGPAIHLTNDASKGSNGGRVIAMNKELRVALEDLKRNLDLVGSVKMPVITTERNRTTGTSAQAVVNMFQGWFQVLGFSGCSSHSGRRTFITNAARKISTVGGSLRDVQMLAGHSNLSTTQRYIEADSEAQQRIVQMV